jgi:hypothetical protein
MPGRERVRAVRRFRSAVRPRLEEKTQNDQTALSVKR